MIQDTKKYRMLVIEDNTGDFVIVEELLLEQITAPFIKRAVSFKEAAAFIKEAVERFDVILLDLSLPDNNGQQLVDDVLKLAGDTPVIILTGFENIDFSIRSISMGICDYLLKDELNAQMLYKSILYCIERQKANSVLRKSEKQYSDLFNLSPQPMWVYDMETYRFVQVNKAAVQQYGFTEDEFLNMTILDIRPSEDIGKIKENATRYEKDQGRIDKNLHRKKSGELIETEIFSTPIVINGQKFMSIIAIDITEKKRYENRLTNAIIKTQEDERYEIGGELHDNVCQILATSKLSLGMLKHSFDPAGMIYYNQAHEYISLALEEIRNLSHRLAPAFFDDTTLKDSFEKLINDFNVEKKYRITFNFDISLKKAILNHEVQLNIYRILQEQLRNIDKYAKATEIMISIVIENEWLNMTIADNGLGFNIENAKGGIGITNMRRRAELFSGNMEIESSPGNGCKVMIEMPL